LSQGLSGRTSTWVKECCRLRTIVWPTKALEWCGWPFQPGPSAGIPFADNTRAIITLTGYTGYQRDALKALITMAGAEFTPALTKSNTHLLCMEPNSKKASAAGHWGITVVNHLWIMDSVLCWAWQNVEKYQETGADIIAEGSWTRLAVDNPFLSCFNSQHVLAFAMGTHRRLGAECVCHDTRRAGAADAVRDPSHFPAPQISVRNNMTLCSSPRLAAPTRRATDVISISISISVYKCTYTNMQGR